MDKKQKKAEIVKLFLMWLTMLTFWGGFMLTAWLVYR